MTFRHADISSRFETNPSAPVRGYGQSVLSSNVKNPFPCLFKTA